VLAWYAPKYLGLMLGNSRQDMHGQPVRLRKVYRVKFDAAGGWTRNIAVADLPT
jgi:hypothetical protein